MIIMRTSQNCENHTRGNILSTTSACALDDPKLSKKALKGDQRVFFYSLPVCSQDFQMFACKISEHIVKSLSENKSMNSDRDVCFLHG